MLEISLFVLREQKDIVPARSLTLKCCDSLFSLVAIFLTCLPELIALSDFSPNGWNPHTIYNSSLLQSRFVNWGFCCHNFDKFLLNVSPFQSRSRPTNCHQIEKRSLGIKKQFASFSAHRHSGLFVSFQYRTYRQKELSELLTRVRISCVS